MAMEQTLTVHRDVVADGVATSVVIDFRDDIRASTIIGNVSGIATFNNGGFSGIATTNATLSGTKVTFTLASAPANGALGTLACTLSFPDNS